MIRGRLPFSGKVNTMKNIALALGAALVVALATVPAAEAAPGPDIIGVGGETCDGVYVSTGTATICSSNYCSGDNCTLPGRF